MLDLEQQIKWLRAENAKLRAALEEIAHHYIDSELASREKRGIARRAITEKDITEKEKADE